MLALELDPAGDQAPCKVALGNFVLPYARVGKNGDRQHLNFRMVQLLSVLSG
ncbi:hypothetical protein [Bradyrhizobium japonicum]|uniref:hypothetical protein n=1 Tax=Bradyrhizobium japonicum TaxID=375 RepID=UPI001E5EE3BC|nr:hypothetical protein [Bradyrhizobium japonicum]MCD9825135.1 hypothetical protein [Bradyrhizobium japonicum]MCD9898001.1 hypothetical protein [Bradyrhizobium japonicum]MEB2671195.1 hypothetical protein [Bradyrhizobium japonicum]WLB28569.1 hypothetical protein QIH85_43475 [Bradyrhizobium japonicum]WRI90514.1 hypothetical protein R3F75_06090 [Bradyrhizobium japonicum]